jgi:hypothetical protein
MVDALREVSRVLRRGGALVDLRPVSARCPIALWSGDAATQAGEADAFGMAADDRAADAAVQHVVERGWFVPRRETRFDIDFYWDTPEELAAYIETSTRMQRVLPSYHAVERADREFRAAIGGKIRLRCRRPFLLSVYVKS